MPLGMLGLWICGVFSLVDGSVVEFDGRCWDMNRLGRAVKWRGIRSWEEDNIATGVEECDRYGTLIHKIYMLRRTRTWICSRIWTRLSRSIRVQLGSCWVIFLALLQVQWGPTYTSVETKSAISGSDWSSSYHQYDLGKCFSVRCASSLCFNLLCWLSHRC